MERKWFLEQIVKYLYQKEDSNQYKRTINGNQGINTRPGHWICLLHLVVFIQSSGQMYVGGGIFKCMKMVDNNALSTICIRFTIGKY